MTSLYEPLRNKADDTFGTFQGSAEDYGDETDELQDEFEEENMVAKDREAIWSPPGNYLDQSPGRPGGRPRKCLLGTDITEERQLTRRDVNLGEDAVLVLLLYLQG